MELLKDGVSLKVLILTLVTIALISPPDQCEATQCYKCPGPCSDAQAKTEDCTGLTLPCYLFTLKDAGGSVKTSERGCNVPGNCLEKLELGTAQGCKEATGPKLAACGSAYQETDVLKYCACAGDKCNGENSFSGNGDTGGGGDSSGGAGLSMWLIESGLMMASTVIAFGVI